MGLPTLPPIDLSFSESHQQRTDFNQAGAVVNTGISFAPLPAPYSPTSNDSVFNGLNKTLVNGVTLQWAVVVAAGLGLLFGLISLFRRR